MKDAGFATGWHSSKAGPAFKHFAQEIRRDNGLDNGQKIMVVLDGDCCFASCAKTKKMLDSVGFDVVTLPPRSPDGMPLDYAGWIILEEAFLKLALSSKSKVDGKLKSADDEWLPGDENDGKTGTKDEILPKAQVARWLVEVKLDKEVLKKVCSSMSKRVHWWATQGGARYQNDAMLKQRGIWS